MKGEEKAESSDPHLLPASRAAIAHAPGQQRPAAVSRVYGRIHLDHVPAFKVSCMFFHLKPGAAQRLDMPLTGSALPCSRCQSPCLGPQ